MTATKGGGIISCNMLVTTIIPKAKADTLAGVRQEAGSANISSPLQATAVAEVSVSRTPTCPYLCDGTCRDLGLFRCPSNARRKPAKAFPGLVFASEQGHSDEYIRLLAAHTNVLNILGMAPLRPRVPTWKRATNEAEDFVNIRSKLVCNNLHLATSTLNGNNGEFTGSDDVETTERKSQAQINHSAANKRVHQKSYSGNRADPDDKSRRAPGGNHVNQTQLLQKIQQLEERLAREAAARSDEIEKLLGIIETGSLDDVRKAVDPAPDMTPESQTFNIPTPKGSGQARDPDGKPKFVPNYDLRSEKLYIQVDDESLLSEDHSAHRILASQLAVSAVGTAAAMATGLILPIAAAAAANAGYQAYKWFTSEQHPEEYSPIAVTELYTRGNPDNQKFRALKHYGFNATYEAMICPHGIEKLALQHPGLKPTAYTQSTFEYTLASCFPELGQTDRRSTATYYHQLLLADEAVRNASCGRLQRMLERI